MRAMPSAAPVFLSAQWRHLAMLNFEVDPQLLAARLPRGCELDFHQGRTFLSVVGFLFLDTKVLGIPIPFHRDFEEVNLRFYVRHRAEDGSWRRGVVFVKELVPRWAIAFVAKTVYGEPYEALPMRHRLSPDGAVYQWKRGGRWEGLEVRCSGESFLAAEGSEESFITEHYWGYTRQSSGDTAEYEVVHPIWRLRTAREFHLEADLATLYGPEFAAVLETRPTTAFLADGSDIAVKKGRQLG